MILTGMDFGPLLAKLESTSKFVADEGKKKALRAGGNVIKVAIEENAPVLDKKVPGSDALEPGSLRDGNRVAVREEDGDLVALIGPRAKVRHVARFVEFGHRQVVGSETDGSKKRKHKQKFATKDVGPVPYLRGAYDLSEKDAEQAVLQSILKTVEEELNK